MTGDRYWDRHTEAIRRYAIADAVAVVRAGLSNGFLRDLPGGWRAARVADSRRAMPRPEDEKHIRHPVIDLPVAAWDLAWERSQW